jgi:DNA-binding transcriptional ArsR family regulator
MAADHAYTDNASGSPEGPPHLDAEDMVEHAESASSFLKALSHEGRLMILCHLSTGEKSVTELETLLSSRQAAVSQQLARLRLEGLVSHRREGKVIFYSLADEKARRTLELMHELFCNAQNPPRRADGKATG